MGIVYIMTNPCLQGWVKIGKTIDVQARLNQLNSQPNIPLSFRCYATYEVDDMDEVEKRIHNILDTVNYSLRARETIDNGRTREREFFRMSPEAAYNVFVNIALLRNDMDKLTIIAPTLQEAQIETNADTRTKRTNSSFQLLQIPVGESIQFIFDEECSAKVVDSKNTVEFEGVQYSVSALAKKLLVEKKNWSQLSQVNGWRYFMYHSKTLFELRDLIGDQEDEATE